MMWVGVVDDIDSFFCLELPLLNTLRIGFAPPKKIKPVLHLGRTGDR